MLLLPDFYATTLPWVGGRSHGEFLSSGRIHWRGCWTTKSVQTHLLKQSADEFVHQQTTAMQTLLPLMVLLQRMRKAGRPGCRRGHSYARSSCSQLLPCYTSTTKAKQICRDCCSQFSGLVTVPLPDTGMGSAFTQTGNFLVSANHPEILLLTNTSSRPKLQ